MVLAVIDTETRGLDARKGLTWCVMIEKENDPEKTDTYHFYEKKKVWEFLLEKGMRLANRKKILNVYGHNHEFDAYSYMDLKDPNLKFFCTRPFIASYEVQGHKWINFLDSLAIFRMSLAKLGDMLGLEKLETPEEFINAERITMKRLIELQPYIERDCEIVMVALKKMKKKMAEEGIQLRRLYTISQIAVNYFINDLKKDKYNNRFFFNVDRGMLHRTRHKDYIHGAYRGGRVECWEYGKIEKVTYIDVNNLYGYASTQIDFPDLKTEQLIKEPLNYTTARDLFESIGISRVLMYNEKNKIGILPVRTETESYYPKEDSYILGDYTHIEIKKALQEGYKLLGVEWSLIWQKAQNPFQRITPRLYELRKKTNDPFDNFFFKEMQNRSYGKLAQRKSGYEIVIDSVENAEKYLKDQYEIIMDQDYSYVYRKQKEESEKNYYAPIIPALINAWARCFMYDQYKKIPFVDLCYTDTDSIIFKGNHLDKFEIADDLGAFKVEYQNVPCIIKGKKTYAVDDEIKVSGFRKSDISFEEFEEGKIKTQKMLTLKSAPSLGTIGKFIEEKRDLSEQEERSQRIADMYASEKVLKDKNILDITYFRDKLIEIVNS